MNLTWMNRYVIPDSGIELWERAHRISGYRFVTDSRCLLAVAEVGPDDNPGSTKRLDIIRALLPEEPVAPAMTTTLGDLWLWLDHLERDRCLCLHDTFYELNVTPLPHCQDCDGEGWHFPDYEPPSNGYSNPRLMPVGSFFGLPVDLNRLTWWLCGNLEDVDASPVRIWVSCHGKGPAITFAAYGWRLVISSLSRVIYTGQYREYAPGAGEWWHQRRDPIARMIAADWCQENGIDPATVFRPETGVYQNADAAPSA